MRYEFKGKPEPFQGYTEFDEFEWADTEVDFWLQPWIDKFVRTSALPAPPRRPTSRELFPGGLGETDLSFEAEPFRYDDTFRYRRDPYAPSEETGIQQMIETGKISQHCVTLWDDFCKAAKEWRRTASAVENKKWVIHHEEFKLKKWRCADQSIRLPDTVKRICKEVSDKVERLKAELSPAEAEHQQAVAVYRALVNKLTTECSKLNINTLVCPR